MISLIAELSIKDFAIIDDISVSFQKGLTVLTGETGAGKSIIIDAVQLLTGARGSVDFVRYGAQKAEIIGQFIVTSNKKAIFQLCQQYDIDLEEDTLILERTILKSGKSVCRINGKMVTLTILRTIGQLLTQIHSQHDTVYLMDRNTHLTLLDNFYASKIMHIKNIYTQKYEDLKKLENTFEEIQTDDQEIVHRIDLLQFQMNELEGANLIIDEDVKLEREKEQLQNFENIHRSIQEAYYSLHGEGKGLELIYNLHESLQSASHYDPFIQKQSEITTNLYYQLEDIHLQIAQYMDSLHFDEDRLNEIETRLNELHHLKRKYGSTVQEMLDYYENIKIELDQLTNREVNIEKLSKKISKKRNEVWSIGEQLHTLRKKAAKDLENKINKELQDLYLQNAQFKINVSKNAQNELNENGISTVGFKLSPNLGEPLKELDKIASGGELSRIMLALKKVFAQHDRIQTVIFDEIDAGVSGRVAQAIAEKMYQISTSTQTICITHLPQVAAMADHHLNIQKIERKNRTTTQIKPLEEDDIVHELGKMMTGTKLTKSALEYAEELLKLTSSFKQAQ